MAEGQTQETGAREEGSPDITGFDITPEFEHFKNVMRRVLAVPKSELDSKVKRAKKRSPRIGNPNAPGRKSSK